MRQGTLDGLEPATDSGALKLVGDKGAKNYDPAEAEKLAAAILVANPKVKAFMVGAGPMANGVINAIKAVGREGEVDVIGLDPDPIAAQNIMLGLQKAAVVKNPHDEMKLGCVAVISALNGDPMPTDVFDGVWDLSTPPMPFHDVPLSVINKDTIQEAIDADVLTKDEACDGIPSDVGGICAQ
jgi:ribose transport system substrate-binding protein